MISRSPWKRARPSYGSGARSSDLVDLAPGGGGPEKIWLHRGGENGRGAVPVDSEVRRLKRAHRVEGTRDNRLLVKQSQTVVLAVKPQMMAQVLEEIRPEATPKKLFISIAAGFPLRRLETGLGGQSRVVRVMP